MGRIDIEQLTGRTGLDVCRDLLAPVVRNLNDICRMAGKMPFNKYPDLGSIANDVAPVTGAQFTIELHEFRKFMEQESVSEVDKAWDAIQLIAMSVALTDTEYDAVCSYYQCAAQEWAMRRHLMTRGTEAFRSTFFWSRRGITTISVPN